MLGSRGLVWICLAVAPAVHALQYYAPPTGAPPIAVKLKNGEIVSSRDGTSLTIKAAIWESAGRQPFSSFIRADHGEAAGNSTVSRVLVTAAYQLRCQGFNAVYLSLDLNDLQPKPKTPIPSSHNMCRQVSLNDTPRSSAADISAALQLPPEGHDDSTSSRKRSNAPQEQCLTLLPTTAMLDRFLWSVQWFLANGLYVIISGVDSSICTSLNSSSRDHAAACVLSVNATADAWVQLWNSVKTLPGFEEHIQGRVMLQLLQDPSPAGLLWETSNTSTGHKQPGLVELYLSIMDAVDRSSPGSALFILQGPQQAPAGTPQWGNGFTARTGISTQRLSDPTPLFKALLNKAYRDQVILAPRIFSPTTSNSTGRPHPPAPAARADVATDPSDEVQSAGPDSVKVLDNSFHQLSRTGYCVAESTCLHFPVVVTQQHPESVSSSRSQGMTPSDTDLFANYILSRQVEQQKVQEEVATGSWYHWEMLSYVGSTQLKAGAAADVPLLQQQSAGSSSSPDSKSEGQGEPAGGSNGQGKIRTFVYSAGDDGDSDGGMVFDIP